MRIKFLAFALLLMTSKSFAETRAYRLQIDFPIGVHSINANSLDKIEDLAKLIRDESAEKIFLVGHADQEGSFALNKRLSLKRAQSVEEKLKSFGVVAQIEVRGAGEEEPIADNSTLEGRALNRSVVVVFKTPQKTLLENSLMENKIAEAVSYRKIHVSKSETPKKKIKEINMDPLKKLDGERLQSPPKSASMPKSKNSLSSSSFQASDLRYQVGLSVFQSNLKVSERVQPGLDLDFSSEPVGVSVGGALQAKVGLYWLGIRVNGLFSEWGLDSTTNLGWNEVSPFLIKAAFIADYEKGPWGYGLDVDLNQEAFAIRELQDFEFESNTFLGLKARLSHHFFMKSKDSLRLGVNIQQPAFSSGEIGAKGRLGFGAHLDLIRKKTLGEHDLVLRVYYQYSEFKNDQNNQEENITGINLRLESQNWL